MMAALRFHATSLVETEGGHWFALVCQATSKDKCIFQGLTSSLTEIGSGWMSGITQQGYPTISPMAHWSAIEDIVAQDFTASSVASISAWMGSRQS